MVVVDEDRLPIRFRGRGKEREKFGQAVWVIWVSQCGLADGLAGRLGYEHII